MSVEWITRLALTGREDAEFASRTKLSSQGQDVTLSVRLGTEHIRGGPQKPRQDSGAVNESTVVDFNQVSRATKMTFKHVFYQNTVMAFNLKVLTQNAFAA
ncbi:hypothetical protein MHU86_5506 [Fragilaria crotonensis]|nr:hypothetical protein MHU86_5506 [Fragilaria crotonensis]